MKVHEVGESIQYNCIDIGESGEGVGKTPTQFTVFCPDVLPGESAEVTLVQVKKNYAIGKVSKRTTDSPSRIKPKCSYFPTCGSCQIQHLTYPSQLLFKQKKVKDALVKMGEISHIEPLEIIPCKNDYEYRNKISLPIQTINNSITFGYYENTSHTLVPIQSCPVMNQLPPGLLPSLTKHFDQYKVSSYDEKAHKGHLRHLTIRYSEHEKKLSLIFTCKKPAKLYIKEWISKTGGVFPIKSIWLNINSAKNNVILGPHSELIWGRDPFQEKVDKYIFTLGPTSFFQINHHQLINFYKLLEKQKEILKGASILELYCGLGFFSICLSKWAKEIEASELNKESIAQAKENAKINNISNIKFLSFSAEAHLKSLIQEKKHFDILFVDPPRSGLNIEVIELMVELKPKHILYVSCKPSTWARDAKLLKSGDYELILAQPLDMFPQTTHVEIFSVFTRKD